MQPAAALHRGLGQRRVQVGVRIGDGETIRVESGAIHEQYMGGSDDIAILLLERPAPALPWPLSRTPFDSSFVGLDVRLVGYGATDPDGSGLSEHGVHHFHGLVLEAYRRYAQADGA